MNREENDVIITTCDVNSTPKLAEAFKIQSLPFTIVVMPDEKLKYPELVFKEPGYYIDLNDRIISKEKGGFSRLFG